MANEITMSVTLSVRKLDPTNVFPLVNYQEQTAFTATLTGNSGPYVGTISVPQTFVAISLTASGTGGVAKFTNQSGTFDVEIGLYNATRNKFQPFSVVKPGEAYSWRLSNKIGSEEIVGTGTSTAGGGSVSLAAKGLDGTVSLLVEIFPR